MVRRRQRGLAVSAEQVALAESRSTAVVLVDFDGTLSAIVDHPDHAVPLPGAVGVLERLTASFATVAVVSGRPVDFLRRVLPVPALALVGQYGMERWDGNEVIVDPRAAGFAPGVAAAADRAELELPGVFVERKGAVAVTLHWRANQDLGTAARTWAERTATASGLTLYPTRMAVELRPPVPVDKGTAVSELAEGRAAALFVGDDHGDLTAFDALDRFAAMGGYAVRMAVRSSEEPPELVARADVTVDGPAGVVAWLTNLADTVNALG